MYNTSKLAPVCKGRLTPCAREMVGAVVVGACHNVRPEPPPRKLPHRLVLVVEVVVINPYLVAFLDLLWSTSVSPVESSLILRPRRMQLRPCQFHILRSSLELSDSRRQQLFTAHLISPVHHSPRGDRSLHQHDRLLPVHQLCRHESGYRIVRSSVRPQRVR